LLDPIHRDVLHPAPALEEQPDDCLSGEDRGGAAGLEHALHVAGRQPEVPDGHGAADAKMVETVDDLPQAGAFGPGSGGRQDERDRQPERPPSPYLPHLPILGALGE
jgi:hypothetical protein